MTGGMSLGFPFFARIAPLVAVVLGQCVHGLDCPGDGGRMWEGRRGTRKVGHACAHRIGCLLLPRRLGCLHHRSLSRPLARTNFVLIALLLAISVAPLLVGLLASLLGLPLAPALWAHFLTRPLPPPPTPPLALAVHRRARSPPARRHASTPPLVPTVAPFMAVVLVGWPSARS